MSKPNINAAMQNSIEEEDPLDQMTRMKTLYPWLRALGVTTIEVEFSGSGDDGQVDEHYMGVMGDFASDAAEAMLDKAMPDGLPADAPDTVRKFLSEATYMALEQEGSDWCNNDGGQGTVSFDIVEGNIHVDMNVNITHTENSELDLPVFPETEES